MLNVQESQAELKVKNYNQIQSETAWKWGSRAAACFQNLLDGHPDKLACWTLGEEYLHEAVEHAALCADGALVKLVRDAVTPYQEQASAAMAAVIPQSAAPNV